MSGWIEIRAEFDQAPPDWAIFAHAFEAYGCPGSLQDDRPPALSAYLADVPGAGPQANALRERLLALGADRVSIGQVPDQDWSELWKAHFHPVRIGKRFLVCPSWEPGESEPGDRVIVLDPGRAFGTGDHPTTRLCLRLMEAWLDPPPDSLLDLGTGSGILAIAASQLGISSVTATDIDPIAVEVARENAARNGARVELFAAPGLDDARLGGPWPALLSNIISATLIRLAPEIARRMDRQGMWIASGILRDNWPDVRSAAERAGFDLLEKQSEMDWVGAVFRRR